MTTYENNPFSSRLVDTPPPKSHQYPCTTARVPVHHRPKSVHHRKISVHYLPKSVHHQNIFMHHRARIRAPSKFFVHHRPESVHHRKCFFSYTQAVQAVQAVHCLVRRAKGEFLVNARKKAKPNFQRRAVVSFWLMQETHRALVSFLH